jgi:hypothetical protein
VLTLTPLAVYAFVSFLIRSILRLSGLEPLTDGLEGHCSTN